MNRYDKLMQRLADGEHLLIDGATGTEIERRGVAMIERAWNGGGALTDPDIVRNVHADYIRSGAQVIISNTFSTSRHVLEDADMAQHFEFLNRRGVELAIEARDQMQTPDVLVAGGITALSFTDRVIEPETMLHNLEQQAAIMAAAGADLIMLEMMVDVDSTKLAIEAAQKTGLPVWVGFSCRPNEEDGEMRLNRGPALEFGLALAIEKNVQMVFVMHTQAHHVGACLDIVQKQWTGPLGVYAHSGKFVDPNWIFNDTIAPDSYTEYAQRWLARGVQVIGGCCGIGIEHMQHLHSALTNES